MEETASNGIVVAADKALLGLHKRETSDKHLLEGLLANQGPPPLPIRNKDSCYLASRLTQLSMLTERIRAWRERA
jgi:hypothetical protein